jgi:DNA polymerase III epsilon subunit-like protein
MNERLIHAQLVETGRKIIQASPTELIDFDVEADGVPGLGNLRSAGFVAPGGETYYAELKPTSSLYIEANHQFCEAHGLEYERLMEEGMHPTDAMEEIRDWAKAVQLKDDKPKIALAAFNASFDFPWIDLEMKKAGLRHPFGVAGFCTKSLAMALVPNYDWSATAKHKLPPEYSPEGEFTHNALEDAIWQQKQHFAMVGALAARACR